MYQKKAEVNTEVEKLNAASNVMMQIESTTKSIYELADSTRKLLNSNISKMDTIISTKGLDFQNYSTGEQHIIHNNYKLAVIMRDI